MRPLSDKLLEQLYEAAILPNFDGMGDVEVSWRDHLQTDSDSWEHSFEDADENYYILKFDDYPGSSFIEDSHLYETVLRDGQDSLYFGADTPYKYVPNVTGHFTLFKKRPYDGA